MTQQTPTWGDFLARTAGRLIRAYIDQNLTTPATRYHDDADAAEQGVPFAIFAPYNPAVQLIGSFSDWEPIELTKEPSGWWHTFLNLPDGEYNYKFRVQSLSPWSVGQWVDVGDPRAMRVDAANGEASVIRVIEGRPRLDHYVWQHDDKPLPPDDDLVIYELHVGNFSGGEGEIGTFNGVTERLDYLAGLGINAIELMPIGEFPGDMSWGYNPRFPFAPEWIYGSTEDFKRLVDECHSRGIRVILDMVWNHTDTDCPLAQIDHNYWYYAENPDAAEVQFGPKFNYTHWDDNLNLNPAREYARDCILHWIDTYHIDGIRFDATALINNFDVLGWLRGQIKSHIAFKPFILIGEHIPQDPAVCQPSGPMDAAWHESFYGQMQVLVEEWPVNLDNLIRTLDPRQEGFSGAVNVINYTTNHDHERLLHVLGGGGVFGDLAFRRLMLAEGLLLTAPGLPMLWMGSEFGEYEEKTLEARKLHWELLGSGHNQELFTFTQSLIKLRRAYPALNTTAANIEVMVADHERQLLVFKRWAEDGAVVVVMANLADSYLGEVEVPNWPSDGVWHEWTHNYDNPVEGGVLRDKLAESEIKVYVNRW